MTGSGRSGTHWLTSVLRHFVDARHEPEDYRLGGQVIVDCRLRTKAPQLAREGYRLLHLVRDGRDVVRSSDTFWEGSHDFESLCRDWASAIELCDGLETIRLKDLIAKQAASDGYRMPHWTEWTDEQTATFWRICGDGMRAHGYAP